MLINMSRFVWYSVKCNKQVKLQTICTFIVKFDKCKQRNMCDFLFDKCDI